MPTKNINGINLYYERHGTGEPLLFLHGLGSSGRDWETQIDYFSQQYEVITVDTRGHGRSDKPAGPYTVPMFAADIAQLLQELEVPPVHVVGLSMGGMMAFQLAVDRPELLRSITIVNSTPELVVCTLRDQITLWQRLLIVRMMGMRKMGEFLAERLLPQPEHAELRQQFADRWAENDKTAYLAAMKALIGWTVIEHLPQINLPVLVITADQDYTPVSTKQAYTDLIPGAELTVIPDSHHALPVERPEQFNKTLHNFLQHVSSQEVQHE